MQSEELDLGAVQKEYVLRCRNFRLWNVPCQSGLPIFIFVLFAIFVLHSRESELYRYTLDGKSALAWELPFSRFMGHLSST